MTPPQLDHIGITCDGVLQHVYPTFGPAHITLGPVCWCHPELAPDNPHILLHNIAQ